MNFYIQIGNPRILKKNTMEATIGDAIEEIFPLVCEHFFIVWNNIHIPISYKYDLSVIFDDIIYIIQKISETKEGQFENHWPSDTFSTKWDIHWNDEDILISSEWYNVLGGLELVLNENNTIKIKKKRNSYRNGKFY